jgi:hypothetical protein
MTGIIITKTENLMWMTISELQYREEFGHDNGFI